MDQRDRTSGDPGRHQSADVVRTGASNVAEGCHRQAPSPQLGCRRSNPERDGGVGVPQAEEKTLLAQEEGTHHWLFRHHARQR